MLSLMAAIAAANGAPERVDLFVPNAGDVSFPCYRQPALIAADDTGQELLAFAEGRTTYTPGISGTCAPAMQGGDAELSHPQEIGGLLLRSSRDGGHTWSSPRFVYGSSSISGPNIDFYTVVRDSSSKRLFLTLQQQKNSILFTSDDAGETWDGPKNMSIPAPPEPYKNRLWPAVGHGVQLSQDHCAAAGGCLEAGRMIMPFVCQNGSDHGDSGQHLGLHSCLVYSDNGGESWQWGGFGPPGSKECQVVQTRSQSASASLYANIRNFGKTPGHRWTAQSTTAGESLSEYAIDESLSEPVTKHWTGVVASIVSLAGAGANGGDVIVYSGPASAEERSMMTLRTSYDSGSTWAKSRVLWPGLASYSDMVAMPDGIGIIYENGDITFSDRISFSAVPLAWIEEDEAYTV